MYVRHIRDVYRQHIEEIDAIEDETKRLNSLIEHNVIEQCINLYKMGFVQRARRTSLKNQGVRLPQIHGLVYDPSSGKLEQLDIKIRDKAQAFGKVFDILPELRN